jgi:alpha-glucosidase (family GH31 glycosyl hydrolase)
MVGSSLMQTPFVKKGEKTRTLILPNCLWYSADQGLWIEGNRVITLEKDFDTTPIFIRDGSIIPMQKGTRKNNHNNLTDIELYIYLSPQGGITQPYMYHCDDGISDEYKKGKQSEYGIQASTEKGIINITIKKIRENFAPVHFTFITVSPFKKLIVTTEKGEKGLYSQEEYVNHFGRRTLQYVWTEAQVV